MSTVKSYDEPKFKSYEGEVFDRTLHSIFAQYMGLFSPATLTLSYVDWIAHLRLCPAKQLEIAKYAGVKTLDWFNENFLSSEPCVVSNKCQPQDPRFKHAGWNELPFNMYASIFLLHEDIWSFATQNVRGVSRHHSQVVHFITREWLDVISPANIPWMNPEVIETTVRRAGSNFVDGFKYFYDDYMRFVTKAPVYGSDEFKVGIDVAVTPGKVVFRNNLMELIQYSPTTDKVAQEPVLIVPAWIMKYYILDLSPHNSMVKYLVDQGHTVFMISWKNPTASDRDLHLNSYITLGINPALDMINKIIPNTKVHAVGYCLGGTLLMIAAAAMAGKDDERLASITLFAAQVDFKDAGELTTLIDASQVAYLEDVMWEKGYLDGAQMQGTFSMLHSSDLIWSRMVRNYMLGEREKLFDIMAWDNDTTRLPYHMHSEYLRRLFLNNELVQGLYSVDEKYVTLSNIRAPIFAVATSSDHVAPWQSVYKVHLFTKSDITFVLTNGGHNAGILSEPGHANRSFKMATSLHDNTRLTYDDWLQQATDTIGSWWPVWHEWLNGVGNQEYTSPPSMGDTTNKPITLGDAPGSYVLQR